MKPNHHWCVHLPQQLHDLVPVYGFWTFLGERLNKSLKNFNSNSHRGGEMEASMMREFGRNVYIQCMVCSSYCVIGKLSLVVSFRRYRVLQQQTLQVLQLK